MINEKHCPHCKFISDTFPGANEMSKREYWLMTEMFVYLHDGKDYCYENNSKFSPTIMNGNCCNQVECPWCKKFVCTKLKFKDFAECIFQIQCYEKSDIKKELDKENKQIHENNKKNKEVSNEKAST